MKMKTHVEFKSDQFPAYDGEEEEINPGRWGKRLAEFLFQGLKTEGIKSFLKIGDGLSQSRTRILSSGLDAGIMMSIRMGFCVLLSQASLL